MIVYQELVEPFLYDSLPVTSGDPDDLGLRVLSMVGG